MPSHQTPTPPAAPQSPVPVDPAIASLRGAETELNSQLTVIRAQQQALRAQLRSADRPMRTAIQARMMDVNVQLATTQAQLANVQAQLAAQGLAPAAPIRMTAQPPPFNAPQHYLDSDQVTGIVIVFILAVLMPISIGLLRRMWRGTSKPAAQAGTDTIAPRLDRLEHATDAIALEIERISEGQRFVTKVLAERPVAAPAAPPASASVRDRGPDASAVNEGKPYLALGAGPIEPIRMHERQSVRQSITPH